MLALILMPVLLIQTQRWRQRPVRYWIQPVVSGSLKPTDLTSK